MKAVWIGMLVIGVLLATMACGSDVEHAEKAVEDAQLALQECETTECKEKAQEDYEEARQAKAEAQEKALTEIKNNPDRLESRICWLTERTTNFTNGQHPAYWSQDAVDNRDEYEEERKELLSEWRDQQGLEGMNRRYGFPPCLDELLAEFG